MIEKYKICMGCMCELNTEDVEVCPKCGYRLNDKNPSRGLQPRTILNEKYLVGKVIGEGGFGITYIGYDLILNSRIAIKEYFPVELATRDTTVGAQTSLTVLTGSKEEQYKKGIERFVNEASNLAKFNDLSGIVSVRDFFYENKTAYMVMEYIDGMTLTEYLKQNGDMLPYNTVLEMMKPVMDSLQKVHEAGIIHRDISPDNIMVTKTGEVKLIDFGAARIVGNEDQKSLTVILKHGYAPQEQYQTNGKQGPWTDIYALAATMYRMITGIVPQESTERILSGDTVVPVNKLIADVPKNVSLTILRGMSVSVEKRYQSIKQFAQGFHNSSYWSFYGWRMIAAVIFVFAVMIALVFVGIKKVMINRDIAHSEAGDSFESEQFADERQLNEAGLTNEGEEIDKKQSEEAVLEEIPREELEKRIEFVSGHGLMDAIYEDFNNDGVKEMVGACVYVDPMKQDIEGEIRHGEPEQKTIAIWYADANVLKMIDSFQALDTVTWEYLSEGKESGIRIDYLELDNEEEKQESKSYLVAEDGIICGEKKNDQSEKRIIAQFESSDHKKELPKDELERAVVEKSGKMITDSFYDDFNGDGFKELIAFCDIKDESGSIYERYIWFADENEVVEMWNYNDYLGYIHGYVADNYNDNSLLEIDEPSLAQFGKKKQVIFTYGARRGGFFVIGYEDNELWVLDGRINDEPGVIQIIDGIAYNERYYNSPYFDAMYQQMDADYELIYLNGDYTEYGMTKISKETLKMFKNWDETNNKIDDVFKSDEPVFFSIGDMIQKNSLADEFDWDYRLEQYRELIDVICSQDGNIYLNYQVFQDKSSKMKLDSDYYSGRIFDLSSPYDYRDYLHYFYVVLKADYEKMELEYSKLVYGYYDAGMGGDNSPNLINLVNSPYGSFEYIHSESDGPGESEEGIETDDIAVLYTAVVQASDGFVNYRKGPGKEFEIMEEINNGETLNVIGENDNGKWLQISRSGTIGWVAASEVVLNDGEF